MRLHVLQTWYADVRYEIAPRGVLDVVPEELYYAIRPTDVTLRTALTAYDGRGFEIFCDAIFYNYYAILTIIMVFIMALVYSLFGLDLLGSISASFSMMSNVGPCFGMYGSSMSSFSAAPEFAKFLMGIQMIIGRLGIYSVLLIFVLYRKRA